MRQHLADLLKHKMSGASAIYNFWRVPWGHSRVNLQIYMHIRGSQVKCSFSKYPSQSPWRTRTGVFRVQLIHRTESMNASSVLRLTSMVSWYQFYIFRSISTRPESKTVVEWPARSFRLQQVEHVEHVDPVRPWKEEACRQGQGLSP